MIPRTIEDQVINDLKTSQKAVVIYGPRQAGKTTLAKNIVNKLGLKTLTINGESSPYRDALASQDFGKIKEVILGHELIFIDEAQKIDNIGICLKMIVDNHPEIKVLATGSSSFDLANKIAEPMTGRVWSYTLYPISAEELITTQSNFEYQNALESHLIYGSYPEIYSYPNKEAKIKYLNNLTNSYLYKDILEFTNIKHSDKISKLLNLIALQLGNEVSLSELGTQLGISKETVATYIDLLEKSFVIFTLRGFSRNLRKEVTKMNKIYFYDLGVRNSIINNFNSLNQRNDTGPLFENYLIIERFKRNSYHQLYANSYFWRLNTGAEIDYIEERNGVLSGFEFKLSKKTSKSKDSWLKSYAEAEWKLINRDNFLSFITNTKTQ